MVAGRQASVCTPLHAGVQGAINRLLGTFRHVTLLIGSTDLGTFFLSRDQKHTNLVRVSTQNWDQVRPSGRSLRITSTAAWSSDFQLRCCSVIGNGSGGGATKNLEAASLPGRSAELRAASIFQPSAQQLNGCGALFHYPPDGISDLEEVSELGKRADLDSSMAWLVRHFCL